MRISGGDQVLTELAGVPHYVSRFAHTLRRTLWEEHAGINHTCTHRGSDAECTHGGHTHGRSSLIAKAAAAAAAAATLGGAAGAASAAKEATLGTEAGSDGDGAGDGASGSDEEDEALLHQLELAGDDLDAARFLYAGLH